MDLLPWPRRPSAWRLGESYSGGFPQYESFCFIRRSGREGVGCCTFRVRCGVYPVVGHDSQSVGRIDNKGDVAEDEVTQRIMVLLDDGERGGWRAWMFEVACVAVGLGCLRNCHRQSLRRR